MQNEKIAPVHPGVYLKELLDELGISQYRLAKDLRVPAMRINDVVNGRRPITAELALRLGRYFEQNPRYWPNLQALYDMDVAEDALSEEISRGGASTRVQLTVWDLRSHSGTNLSGPASLACFLWMVLQ